MTKCTVFGENTETNVKKKPIEFTHYVSANSAEIIEECVPPIRWDNIILLSSLGDYDAMYAYDTGDENAGAVYLGHWNDGVV